MAKNIIFLDLETGGLNPALHQITQIAAVAVEATTDLPVVGDAFECKITLVPGKYDQEALNIQHYDPVVWDAEGVGIQQALDKLCKWAEPWGDERIGGKSGKAYKAADVGGYNIEFDRDFLSVTAKRNKIWLPLALWTGGVLDVLQLAKWESLRTGESPKNFQLETVCKFRGIPDFMAHGAPNDTAASIRLARSYLAGF